MRLRDTGRIARRHLEEAEDQRRCYGAAHQKQQWAAAARNLCLPSDGKPSEDSFDRASAYAPADRKSASFQHLGNRKSMKREFSVRFFTADGVEVGSLLDLAGPHKDELVERIITALARGAARRDHLAEIGRQPNDQHHQSKLPADEIKNS